MRPNEKVFCIDWGGKTWSFPFLPFSFSSVCWFSALLHLSRTPCLFMVVKCMCGRPELITLFRYASRLQFLFSKSTKGTKWDHFWWLRKLDCFQRPQSRLWLPKIRKLSRHLLLLDILVLLCFVPFPWKSEENPRANKGARKPFLRWSRKIDCFLFLS